MLVLDGIGIRQRFVKDMFQMGPGNNWDVLNVNWPKKTRTGIWAAQNREWWPTKQQCLEFGEGVKSYQDLDTKEIGWLL